MFKSDKDLRKAVPKKIVTVVSRGVSSSQKSKQLLSTIPQKSEKNNFDCNNNLDHVAVTRNDVVYNSSTKNDDTSRTHILSSSSSSSLNIIDITKQEREKRMKLKQSISSSIKLQSWWRLIYYHHRYYQNLWIDIQNKLIDIEKLYLLLFQQKSILFVSPIHVIDSMLHKYIILQRYSNQCYDENHHHYHYPHSFTGSYRSSQKSINGNSFGDMELLTRLCKYLLLPSINTSNYEKNIIYHYHHHRDDGMRLLKCLFFIIIKKISNYYFSSNTIGGMNSKSNKQVIASSSNSRSSSSSSSSSNYNSNSNSNSSSSSSSSLFLKEELSILVDTLSAFIGLEAPYKMEHTSELSTSYNTLIHHLMVDNKCLITIRHCCLSIIFHQLFIHSVDNHHSKTFNNNHESSMVVCSQLFNIIIALNNNFYIKSNDNSCKNVDNTQNINSYNINNSNLFSSLLKFDITTTISTSINKAKQDDKEDEDERMKLFVQYIFSIPMLTLFLSSQNLTDFCSSLYFLQLLSFLLSSETIPLSSSTTASTETSNNDYDNIRNRKMNMNNGNEYLDNNLCMQTIKSGLWILGNLLSLLPCLLQLIESRIISMDILSRYIHVSSIWFERYMPRSFLQGKNNIIWHKTQSSNVIAVALPYGLEKQLLTVYQESVMLMLLKQSLFVDYVNSNSNDNDNNYSSRCTDNSSNVNRYDDNITDNNLDWFVNESDMKEISESLHSSSYTITSTTLQHDVESSTWLTAKWAKKIVNNLFSNFTTKKSYSSSGSSSSSSSKLKDVSLKRDNLQLLHSICKLWGNIMPNAACSNIDTLQWKSISLLTFTNNSIVISRLWYVLFNQLCHHDINKLINSYLLSYKSIHHVLLTIQGSPLSSSSLSQSINVHKDSTDDVLNLLVTLLSFLRVSLIALDDSELYDCGVSYK